MKFSRQLVLGSLAVLVLSACSSSPTQRRQAKDDFDYLETTEFKPWVLPQGATPQFYPNYDIPQGAFHGGVGNVVDIRPPQQVLELIPGARAERQNGEVTLWMLRQDEAQKVWDTALKMIAERKIPLRKQTDSMVETDWVDWVSEDEDVTIGSRYLMSMVETNNRYGFKISLIGWRENGQVQTVSTTNKERYNAFMTNLVTTRYDSDVRAEAARRAQELVKQIPITMGSDRSGFPVIIARTPYDVLCNVCQSYCPKWALLLKSVTSHKARLKPNTLHQMMNSGNRLGLNRLSLNPGLTPSSLVTWVTVRRLT